MPAGYATLNPTGATVWLVENPREPKRTDEARTQTYKIGSYFLVRANGVQPQDYRGDSNVQNEGRVLEPALQTGTPRLRIENDAQPDVVPQFAHL